MKTPPKRTGHSDLSDNELLLFDMLFNANASILQMMRSAYAEHMNCEYSHSLDDIALHRTIDSLLSRRLIQRVGNSAKYANAVFSLTQLGGSFWERERTPDWQRYAATQQKQLGCHRTGSIVAISPTEQTARRCLGAMFASGLITPNGAIRTRTLFNSRLLPWKSFPVLCVVRCATSDDIHHSPKSVKWEVYESSRCWWRSIAELLTLSGSLNCTTDA